SGDEQVRDAAPERDRSTAATGAGASRKHHGAGHHARRRAAPFHRCGLPFACLLAAILFAGRAALAQGVVTDLVSSGMPAEELSEIQLLRFAVIGAAVPIARGMQLDPGDIIESAETGKGIELTCPPDTNSQYRFEGLFRVMMAGVTDDGGCAFELLAGRVDVLTDADTQVDSGGVVLGTEGTQYALSVARAAGGEVSREVVVFDGTVTIRTPAVDSRLQAGNAVVLASLRATPQERPVARMDVARATRMLVNFDTSRALRADPSLDPNTVRRSLASSHSRVLTASDAQASAARLDLAQTQQGYQLNDAAVSNFNKAGVLNQQGIQEHAIDLSTLNQGLNPRNYEILRQKLPNQIEERRTIRDLRIDPGRLDRVDPDGGAGLVPLAPGAIPAANPEIISTLNARVSDGTATSLDLFELSEAYRALNDVQRADDLAVRAQAVNAVDLRLSQEQLRQLQTSDGDN
ncbi:MAG: hypothetical protein AAGE01_21470, partial [Pseudomonadota bacterium]